MIELAPHQKRGLALANPILNASGILGFAGEARGWVALPRLGAFVTNALTYKPRTSAHPPNAAPLPNGVLIHTGLPNPGVRAALRKWDHEWARLGPPVIVHLAATTPDEVRRSVEYLEQADGVGGVELGLRDDLSTAEAQSLIRAAVGGPPLIVRLPLARAPELSQVAARAGADALTVSAPARASPPGPISISHQARNGEGATQDRAEKRKWSGRLYSPECFPAALEAVRAVASQDLGLPIIGAGGIFSIENARTMLEAGAAAVQLDAVLWNEPTVLQHWTMDDD
jgi:dihydroorotate dehydrogenase (NAD+) catalytic subunit